MSNVTVDDTNGSISYGPGWGTASPNDPALSFYFQSTYHATENVGASFSLTFAGNAIYFFGSKGPDRGNYTVHYDSKTQALSAYAAQRKYQELLFQAQFDSDSTQHTVSLNNTSDQHGPTWIDLDFITISSSTGPAAENHNFSSTISPLPLPTTQGEQSSRTTASGAPHPSSNSPPIVTTSRNPTTFILAVIFGVFFVILLIGVVCSVLIRSRAFITRSVRRPSPPSSPKLSSPAPRISNEVSQWQSPTQRSFRPPNQITSLASETREVEMPTEMREGVARQSSTRQSSTRQGSTRQSSTQQGSTQQGSSLHESTARPASPRPARQGSARQGSSRHESSRPASPRPARPWSPLTTPIKALINRDDTESMKSTFLKV